MPYASKKKTKSAVVLRFVNTKHKAELLHQAKKLKRTGVYLNEHLTKKNANIVRHTRNVRKQNKIQVKCEDTAEWHARRSQSSHGESAKTLINVNEYLQQPVLFVVS